MINLFSGAEAKKQRKHIEHAIFQVKYARRMKDDLISEETRNRLLDLQKDLKAHLKAKRLAEGVALADNAATLAKQVHPAPRGAYAIRENVEVMLVVMAVALGFRTYFFQPYQIPTGSMQPTLYGITSTTDYTPDWTDKIPARWGKFLLTGSRYKSITAKATGTMPPENSRGRWERRDTYYVITIGGRKHKIHQDLIYKELPVPALNKRGVLHDGFPAPGSLVKKGDLLTRGLLKQGDHIIVNRISVNFARPERGDIVVFSTKGINSPGVRPNSAYIKRLTGLPGEIISIRGGKLYADGEPVENPEVFVRQYEDETYSGYAPRPDGLSTFLLEENRFLMMGDNTYHSLDGRYFGGVDGDNILGTGVFVPWPFFNRGIHNDRAGRVY